MQIPLEGAVAQAFINQHLSGDGIYFPIQVDGPRMNKGGNSTDEVADLRTLACGQSCSSCSSYL